MTTTKGALLCCAAGLAMLSVAGCGGAPADDAKAPAISTAAVDNLVPGGLARSAALHTEIRSAGNECASVTRTFLQGMKDGDEIWDAECAGGESYGVVSKSDGTTEVLSCEAVARQTGTGCFEKF
jgi:hypothetical protein